MTSEEDLITIKIVISRVLTSNGDMAIRLGLPEEYSSVELLGLLEAAKLAIYRRMRN